MTSSLKTTTPAFITIDKEEFFDMWKLASPGDFLNSAGVELDFVDVEITRFGADPDDVSKMRMTFNKE